MAQKTVEEQVRSLRERKDGALEEVVRTHTGPLLAASFGMGFPQSDAEELVQETFTAFLSALERFEGRSSVRTFLFGILYRKALERRRKDARELATDPIDQVFETRFGFMGMWSTPPKGPEEEVLSKETAKLIGQCLEGLSQSQRTAFYLKEVEKESNSAICNILDVRDTHLRVLLFRARNNLRECLEKKWEARP